MMAHLAEIWSRGQSQLLNHNDLKLQVFLLTNVQVGEMTGNEIRPFLRSLIMIPIRLRSLAMHSPGICMLRPIKLSTVIMLGECMRDA